MHFDLSAVPDWFKMTIAAFAGRLVKVLRVPPDLEVCKARPMREGYGFFWNRRVIVHAKKSGVPEITPL